MLKNLSSMLGRLARGWVILGLFVVVVLISKLVIDPFSAKLAALSGGSGLIDLLFAYSPETAFGLIETYGDEGRAAYRHFTSTGDVIFPVAYGLFLSLAMSWLLQRGTAPDSRLRLLNLLPVFAWAFDWLENAMIVTLLSQYPDRPAAVAWIAGLATLAKWLMSGLTVFGLVVSAGLYWKARVAGNRS